MSIPLQYSSREYVIMATRSQARIIRKLDGKLRLSFIASSQRSIMFKAKVSGERFNIRVSVARVSVARTSMASVRSWKFDGSMDLRQISR